MKFTKKIKKGVSCVHRTLNPSNWTPKVTTLVVIALVIGLIITSSVMIASGYHPNYHKMADELNVVQVYDSDEITDSIMVESHKNGTVVVERKIAKCINPEKGIGVDITTEEDVDLSGVDSLTKGAIVAVYYFHNPDEDAVIAEFSYILDR